MPSKTKAQRKFMAAAANDRAFAKKVGVDPSVAREFEAADKKVAEAKTVVKKAKRNPLVSRLRGY